METYVEFMDVNGLEDGRIPPAKPCPFLEGCQFLSDKCPSEVLITTEPYLCMAARLKSFAKTIRDTKSDPNETFFPEDER